MCEDCTQAAEAVIANAPKCGCANCRIGGNVLAAEAPPGTIRKGPQPWCVSCHHFIQTSVPGGE